MACITINSAVLNNLNKDDLRNALNETIDNELAKDVSLMNTALIDECVNALLSIESEENKSFSAFVPLMGSNAFLKSIQPKKSNWKNLNVFARASIIAAVLAASAITANAAYKTATGVDVLDNIGSAIHSKLVEWNVIDSDEETEQRDNSAPETTKTELKEEYETPGETTTAAPKEIKSEAASTTVSQTTTTKTNNKKYIDQLGEDEDDEDIPSASSTTKIIVVPADTVKPEREPQNAYVSSLEAEFDGFKYDYIYGEELSYKGLKLTAVYSNGERKPISISDCDRTKSLNMNVTADYTLRVIYEKCVLKINITVRPDEETRGAKICKNSDFDYFLSSKGAYITKYKGNNKNLNLNTVDGKKVYAIGAEVFKNSNIETITAENTEKLFASAFENCSKLKTVQLGNSLSYLGQSAFKNSGIEELKLSGALSTIPESLCENCKSLKTLSLPENTSVIKSSAFSECEALESVSNTKKIKEADSFAFYNCKNAQFDSSLSQLERAKEYAFAYCGNINFGKLNPGIKEIEKYAFAYCTKLTEVDLPSGFTSVPEGAFRGAHISTLNLPEGLKTIESYAFMSTEFRELTVPNSVTAIGTYSLYSVRMRSITFGKNISQMGENSVFKSTRLMMNVFKNTAAYDYAVENKINYTIIE